MLKLGLIRGETVNRAVWKAIPPQMRWLLIGVGHVTIDETGTPVVNDALLAHEFRDLQLALGEAGAA